MKMMNVGIMWREVHKDDNNLHSIGKQMIVNWEHNEDSLKPWRASANFIYAFKQENDNRILRITPDNERKRSQILAEIDFISYLKTKKLPVLEPLKAKNGEIIITDENENGLFHGVVYERAPGAFINFEDLTKKHWLECGRMMAKLHNASLEFKPNSERRRRTWEQDIDLAIQKLENEDSEIITILQHLKGIIRQLPKEEYYGLIHYDLCYDNIIWNNDSYVIIDFDDAAYFPLVADIAFGIDDVRELPEKEAEEILIWFSTGYTQFKPLPEDWRDQLELFYDLEDSLKFARSKYAYHGTDQKLYPEWLTKLRKRHFASMEKDKERLVTKWKEIL